MKTQSLSSTVLHSRAKSLGPGVPRSACDGGEQSISDRTRRTIEVAELTKECRLALGWSEDAAAAVGGVSRALYRDWEKIDRDDRSDDSRTPVEFLLALKDDPRGLAVFGRKLCSLLGWVPGVKLAAVASGKPLLAHVPELAREGYESTAALVGATCEAGPGGAEATVDELDAIESQLLENAAAIQSALADVRARKAAR